MPPSLKNVDKVLEVPPAVYSGQEQEEEGRRRYEAQKLERMETKWRNGDIALPVPNSAEHGRLQPVHLDPPDRAFGLRAVGLCTWRCHREAYGGGGRDRGHTSTV